MAVVCESKNDFAEENSFPMEFAFFTWKCFLQQLCPFTITGLMRGSGDQSGLLANIAVKTMKQTDSSAAFLKEAQVMTDFHHENLVALYGVCTVGDPFYIVTELCENGSLDSFLAKRKMLKKWVRFTQQHKMGHEIAKG